MYLFIPFILLSIYSLFYSSIFNTQVKKSFLIVLLFITYFLYIFGKIGFLEFGNKLILVGLPFAIYYIFKNRYNLN